MLKDVALGTGHKVFTRGCGGYFGGGGGYEKNPRTSEEGTKKRTESVGVYKNLSTIGTEKNYVL